LQQTIIYVAPPGSAFSGSNAACSAETATLTCLASATAGPLRLYVATAPTTCTAASSANAEINGLLQAAETVSCPNYPGGREPLYTVAAKAHVEDRHFEGGDAVDDTSGIFASGTRPQDILDKAVAQTSTSWVYNEANNNWSITIYYPGAGMSSKQTGSLPADYVKIIVNNTEEFGEAYPGYAALDTMYPTL